MDLRFEEQGRPSPARVTVIPRSELDASGKPFQVGLRVIVEVDAPDRENALKGAGAFAEAVLSAMAFVSGVGIPVAMSETIQSLEPVSGSYEFTQDFDLSAPQPSRGEAPAAAVIQTIGGLSKLSPERFRRVARAFQEVRNGQGESDGIDRFMHYWMGLEALNPLLAKDLNAEPELTKCPKCGAGIVVQTTNGVRAFFAANVSNGVGFYSRMRKLRVGLAHGLGGIDNAMIAEAENLSPVARTALRTAIAHCLSMPQDELRETKAPVSNKIPIRGRVSGRIFGPGPEQLGPKGQQPHFDCDNRVVSIAVTTDGGVAITFETTLHAKLGDGVTAEMNEWGVSGEGISVSDATFSKKAGDQSTP